MAKCQYYESCSVFKENKENNLNRPMSVLKHFERTYCFNKPKKCARYQLKENTKEIAMPTNLLPNENKRIQKIFNKN